MRCDSASTRCNAANRSVAQMWTDLLHPLRPDWVLASLSKLLTENAPVAFQSLCRVQARLDGECVEEPRELRRSERREVTDTASQAEAHRLLLCTAQRSAL